MAKLVWVVMFMMLTEKNILVKGNCFDNIISDVSYTATSTDPGHSPSDAVLDNDRAWCTSQNPPNEYLEVHFGHLYDVCGIVIQGFKNDTVDSYTTKYSLSFSKRKPAWSDLLNNNGSRKDFQIAPDDGNNATENELPSPRLALAVRIHPIETSGSPMCLRVGVYGTAVLNVRCDEHLMIISVSKSSLGPEVKQLYVGQRTPECTFNVIPNTDMTVSIGVGTCGTTRWIRGNYLYYQNLLHGKAEDDGESPVVYSEDVVFNATCVYQRNATLTAAYSPNTNFTLAVTEYGQLNFSMDAFLDSEFNDEYDDQPLEVGSKLYIKVEVRSSTEELDLLLDRCYATPSSNREDVNQRQLIVGGCPDLEADNNTVHECKNSSVQTFEIDVFRFEGAGDRVYFYCDVLVCFARVARSICSDHCEACSSSARRKRRRSLDEGSYDTGSSPVYLGIGPFQIQKATKEKKDTVAKQSNQEDSTEQMVIVLAVSGVALLAIFITVVIVVILLRSKSHSSEHTKILAPGTPTRAHAWSDVGTHTET